MTFTQLFVVSVLLCAVLLVLAYLAGADKDDADEIDTFFD